MLDALERAEIAAAEDGRTRLTETKRNAWPRFGV